MDSADVAPFYSGKDHPNMLCVAKESEEYFTFRTALQATLKVF